MMTFAVMGVILLYLLFTAAVGIHPRTEKESYFSLDDTNILKGLWCIVVVLVHIPAAYQNRIQDMIGSFAYIGVTFFFMTSAYGLEYGIHNKKNYLNGFWAKRLPRLLVPAVLINLISVLNAVLIGGKPFRAVNLIQINRWVIVLLLFYFAFWISIVIRNALNSRGCIPEILTGMVVLAYSVFAYIADGQFGPQWATESWGFLYGMVFFFLRERFEHWISKEWTVKTAAAMLCSGVLGVMYLKFKPVPFWGNYLLRLVLGIAITGFIMAFNYRYKLGNSMSRFLGRISYEIYLMHGTMFAILINLAPELNSGKFICLSLVGTIACAWLIKLITDRILSIHKTGNRK